MKYNGTTFQQHPLPPSLMLYCRNSPNDSVTLTRLYQHCALLLLLIWWRQDAPLDLQMELVELKNNEQLIRKFEDKTDLLDLWKLAVEYPKLRELARNILVLFGSTYVCEEAFYRMKYLKNKYRTRLVDNNLESGIRLKVSSESPDFSHLSANIQNQGSH